MTIRPFIAALCGVLLLTACTPAAPETIGEPASEGSQISSEPLEVVCDDPDAPPELTAEAEDKALPMLMRPEYWNGSVTCGPDLATMLIETRAGEVPAAEERRRPASFPRASPRLRKQRLSFLFFSKVGST